jgi:hypothetical protein
MNKKKKTEPEFSMEELKKFYSRKKEEQEALKKLLKALDEKSKKETKDRNL